MRFVWIIVFVYYVLYQHQYSYVDNKYNTHKPTVERMELWVRMRKLNSLLFEGSVKEPDCWQTNFQTRKRFPFLILLSAPVSRHEVLQVNIFNLISNRHLFTWNWSNSACVCLHLYFCLHSLFAFLDSIEISCCFKSCNKSQIVLIYNWGLIHIWHIQ